MKFFTESKLSKKSLSALKYAKFFLDKAIGQWYIARVLRHLIFRAKLWHKASRDEERPFQAVVFTCG